MWSSKIKLKNKYKGHKFEWHNTHDPKDTTGPKSTHKATYIVGNLGLDVPTFREKKIQIIIH